jgi:preprotein translocase subunit SecD
MHIKKLAYEQTLTIIRNRLDALGIRRNNTRSEEETRILVQLPRLKDPQKAIDLIVKPALLEFKLVDEENMASADWQNKLPLGDEILYETEINDKGDRAKRPWLLKQRTLLNGEYLKDAKQTISSQTNRSMVSLSFDSQGAKKFEKITADNIGKRLAIVLDDVVYSAPNIQEKISGGNAVITGNFSDEEAKNLAMVLRAGALPVPVEVIENRPTGSSPVVLK